MRTSSDIQRVSKIRKQQKIEQRKGEGKMEEIKTEEQIKELYNVNLGN